MTNSPGVNEIEWLADLRTLAEEVGSEILGASITWRVETRVQSSRTRSDVLVELTDGSKLLNGEAKRPDHPMGVTPLDPVETRGTVAKARAHGTRWCFTTNFHQIAIFDSSATDGDPLAMLQGRVIEWIPRALAETDGWWDRLQADEKRAAAESGLRTLFERVRMLLQQGAQVAAKEEVVLDFFAELTDRLIAPLSREFHSKNAAALMAVRERALVAGLDPNNEQDARYLVAQGIFEVLSAVLFHRVLQLHFDRLATVLDGTSPKRGRTLSRTVLEALQEAERLSGDYQSILDLSSVGRWVLAEAPLEAVRHWIAIITFVDGLDVAKLTTDVLGSIFERLISPDRRHEMGQHYTQPRLARSMAAWGIRNAEDSVLDPSCGSGTFLVETYVRHQELGLSHDEILERTFGNDLDPFAAHLAAINLATRRVRKGLNHPLVRLGDAFDLEPDVPVVEISGKQKLLPRVDLIIANPPYGRSHPDEPRAIAHVAKLLGHQDLPYTAAINLAAWFVLLGAGLVKNAGRMAFVLPSAVLQNDGLASWRSWIRKKWDLIVWHTEDDVWFSDARVSPCVLLFTPRAPGLKGTGSLKFVNVREPASGELFSLDETPSPARRAEVRDLTAVVTDGDFLVPGTSPEVLLRFAEAPCVTRVGTLTDSEVGAGQKLGHKFFKLADKDPRSEAVLREVEGLGTTVRINRKYLTPLLSSPKELTSGAPTLLENWLLTLPPEKPGSAAVLAYLDHARSLNVDRAPSVASRGKHWWSVEPRTFNVAVPMSAQFRHQVAWLEPAGVVTNNFNGISFSNPEEAELVAASLASAFGALGTLYMSGELGCEGARRILLSQISQWPALDPKKVRDTSLVHACLSTYRAFRTFPAPEMDELPEDYLQSWRKLTLAVAHAALGPGAKRSDVEQLADEALREARNAVSRRRSREKMALEGRTRAAGTGSSSSLKARFRKWTKGKSYASVVKSLCSGPSITALRRSQDLENFDLFGVGEGIRSVPEVERRLIYLLGDRFEAAWPDSRTHRAELDVLPQRIHALIDEVNHSLLGDAPSEGSPARQTWDALASGVVAMLRRFLQQEVRGTLA